MADEDITKFVGVFVTVADGAHIAEPDHIARIEYRPLEDIVKDMSVNPEHYTETFRHVFAYWLSRGRPGLSSPGD